MEFSSIPILDLDSPVVVSIGNFDGIHRGHLAIFDRMKTLSTPKGTTIVITFFPHPSTIFPNRKPIKLLCTPERKAQLIKQQNIDILITLPFTHEFASQSAGEFLTLLKIHLKMDYLVLGDDAVIGKNREGTPEKIYELARTLQFKVEYLPPQTISGQRISSSLIRELIQQGEFKQASNLLGRPFPF